MFNPYMMCVLTLHWCVRMKGSCVCVCFVHAHVYVLFNEKERGGGVFVKVGMHILSLKGADAVTIH